MNSEMYKKVAARDGFIAALDQSGGSTPRALHNYGIPADSYASEEEMYDLVHQMRTRMIKAPAFNGDNLIGAILFERTVNSLIDGIPTAQYIWEKKGVVPFVKVDKGLEADQGGVQMMKAMPELDKMLIASKTKGIFGTKMRSVINSASPEGIDRIVAQQIEVGLQILSHDLMPILEPEITITIKDKAEAEDLLRDAFLKQLDEMPGDHKVMLKLSLPETPNQYKILVDHPRVLGVVALSGGYPRAQSNTMLTKNTGMVASFSRGFSEGLRVQQSDEAFNAMLAETIATVCAASRAG